MNVFYERPTMYFLCKAPLGGELLESECPRRIDELAMETINTYWCRSVADQHRIRYEWREFDWTFIESFLCSPNRHGPGARSGSRKAPDGGRGIQEHPGVEGHPCR